MKNNVTQLPPKDDKVLDEALHWLSEVERGCLLPEREVLLRKWLQQSPKHKDTFLEMASMWDELDVLAQLSDIFPYKKTTDKSYKSIGFYSLAASLVFCFFFAFYFVSPFNHSIKQMMVADSLELVATYKTKVGERITINLPDNSVITLNTNSEVNIEYSNQERNLILQHGEVHVEVAHEEHRKFLVKAGGKVIEAIGTAFNVQHYNDVDIELIVTEGTVEVSEVNNIFQSNNIMASVSSLIDEPDRKAFSVTAGEQVNLHRNQTIKNTHIKVEKILDDIERRLSWMEGHLVFKGESLQQAVDEISRYSQYKLELKGDDIKKIKIIGRFQTGNIDVLLSTLSENFNINAEYSTDTKIILTLSDRATS